MTANLGTTRRTWDAEGHERRERIGAIAECPGCGAEVECVQETEAWSLHKPGRGKQGPRCWKHMEYGPAQGVCEKCSLLIVDGFERCEVYDLGKKERV